MYDQHRTDSQRLAILNRKVLKGIASPEERSEHAELQPRWQKINDSWHYNAYVRVLIVWENIRWSRAVVYTTRFFSRIFGR